MLQSIGASSEASSFRIRLWIPSGPAASFVFRFSRIFFTSSCFINMVVSGSIYGVGIVPVSSTGVKTLEKKSLSVSAFSVLLTVIVPFVTTKSDILDLHHSQQHLSPNMLLRYICEDIFCSRNTMHPKF